MIGISCFGHVLCADDIIFHGFRWIEFHQWYMFMGCRMVDDLRFVHLDNIKHAFTILDIPDNRDDLCFSISQFLSEFHVDLVNAEFPVPDKDDPTWRETHKLSA